MNLVLIGYRGTGKTTIARCLAERIGWDWVDSDEQIERRCGQSIAELFAQRGESAFRDLESACLAQLAGGDRRVLAVGGGAVVRAENRPLLRQMGPVVWLKATETTIVRRLALDPRTADRRPNLTNSGGPHEVRQLLAQRTPIYRACADLEVDTEEKAPAEVAEEIVRRLRLPTVGTGPA